MSRTLSSEKREKFLASALRLFVANGLQNTSTAEIAQAAGTAAGTLFLYFPTKQHLVDALVLKIGREQSEAVKASLDPALSARETFLTIWNATIRHFLDRMDQWIYFQQVRDTGMVSEAAVIESAPYLDYYFTAIQKGLSERSIKPYPVDLIGEFLYRDIVAMMNLLRLHPDPARREETIASGFDIFWNGIKSTGDQPETN